MGAINCSWTLHRTQIIQLQAEEVTELAGKVYQSEATKEHVLSSIRRNVSRVKEAHESTTTFYHVMKGSDPAEMEDDLSTKVRELKVAQEALLKSISRKKEEILAAQRDNEAGLITAGSPVKLFSGDVEALIDAVKAETNIPTVCEDEDSVPVGLS